jgi:hypothetical protein
MPACTPGVAGWKPGASNLPNSNSNDTNGSSSNGPPGDDFFTANWRYFALAAGVILLVALAFFLSKAAKMGGLRDGMADPLVSNPEQVRTVCSSPCLSLPPQPSVVPPASAFRLSLL